MPGNTNSFNDFFYKNLVSIYQFLAIIQNILVDIFAKLGAYQLIGNKMNSLGIFFVAKGGYPILSQNLKSFGVLFCSKGVSI